MYKKTIFKIISAIFIVVIGKFTIDSLLINQNSGVKFRKLSVQNQSSTCDMTMAYVCSYNQLVQNMCVSRYGYCGIGPSFCINSLWSRSCVFTNNVNPYPISNPPIDGVYQKYPTGFTVSENSASGCQNPGQIALTFDDGPSQYTSRLLNILKINNITASFFLIGENISNYSNIVLQQYMDGHNIGDHTFNHLYSSGLSSQTFNSEINSTAIIIKNITGQYYDYTPVELAYVTTTMIVIFDNLDTLDYSNTKKWINTYTSIINSANVSTDSFVVLNHDTYLTTVNMVNTQINIGKKAGFKFVSLEECIGWNAYQ